VSVFARFHPRLQQAIVARLGWSSLRPVQEEAGKALLRGDNAVVLAPTAGGKTEASMFPTLSMLVSEPSSGVGALYLAPIKALLNNQAHRLGTYTEMVGLRRTVWHGDTTASQRNAFLKDPTELLMTTPESLEVMLVSKRVDTARLFLDLRLVVIDEVHALAGTDRGGHLMSVLERLAALSRHDVQRVGLSATVGNPEAILAWLRGSSARGAVVVDPPKVPGPKQLLVLFREDLDHIARDSAKIARRGKSLLFCQSRATTEAVAGTMRVFGTDVFVHHSAVSKEERLAAEERFHHGDNACIVCTSTLELGIDVGDLDRVLQAEAPETVGSFLQRMGRTGRRAGQAANTTFLCESRDAVLQAIALIELAKAGWVESIEVNDRCWPVLVHQLLVMALAGDGVRRAEAWAHLQRVPDLQGIQECEFDDLVDHMVQDGGLAQVGPHLVLGRKAERRFGRKNFMELYAVFSSPQSYRVETRAGAPVGTLNQGFVDRLVDGVSAFLLGGRAWTVFSIRHDERRVLVERGPTGKKPRWGGYLPQFLGRELCTKIRDIILSEQMFPYLHSSAAAVLEEARADLRGVLEPPQAGLFGGEDHVEWWTFAGGRINATLRYGLEAVGGDWKISPDNHVIKIRAEGLDKMDVWQAVQLLRSDRFWSDDALWDEVAESLPEYRLSKFQALMPPGVQREMVMSFLLDVDGAREWVRALA